MSTGVPKNYKDALIAGTKRLLHHFEHLNGAETEEGFKADRSHCTDEEIAGLCISIMDTVRKLTRISLSELDESIPDRELKLFAPWEDKVH